jgi:uncharacterized membrane protein
VSKFPEPGRPASFRPSRLGQWLGISLLMIAYPLLAHYSSTSSFIAAWPEVSASIALLPALGLLLWLAYSSGRYLGLLLLCLLLAGLGYFVWPFLVRHFEWLYFIQHAASNLGLAGFFGHTLANGSKPLVSRMAETVFGTLSPAMTRYTRQVTIAWTLFFAGTVLVSTLLFLFYSIEAWSFFANILSLPLLALMFALEYRVRLRLVPDERHRPLDSFRAYRLISGKATAAAQESS